MADIGSHGKIRHLFNMKNSRSAPGEVHARFADDPPTLRASFDLDIGEHPIRVDLRDIPGKLPPVYNQGKIGSCTANALAAAMYCDKPTVNPSRLFIYYNERVIAGDVADDSGACLADGIKALQTYGACDEADYPYHDDKVRFSEPPPPELYEKAKANVVVQFENIKADHDHIKAALASDLPVALGLTLYDSFETREVARNGRVPMPNTSKESCLGGHAVLFIGFDEDEKVWIVRNSWGAGWGDGGYCYLPYDYVADEHLATDPWVVKDVKD